LAQLLGRGEAVARVGRQRAGDGPLEARRDVGAAAADRRRRRADQSVGAVVGQGGTRRLAGQHLIEHRPEPVQVDLGVRRIADRMLRWHVRRALDRADQRQVGRDGRAHEAEVAQLGRAALVEQDVLGSDVPVDNALTMRRRDGVCKLRGDALALLDRQHAARRQVLAQAVTLDQLGHHERLAIDEAGVEHGDDVRVDQAPGRRRRRHEPLGEQRVVGVAIRDDLDGDSPADQVVVGAVGRAERASPEDRPEGIAVLQAPWRLNRVIRRQRLIHEDRAPALRDPLRRRPTPVERDHVPSPTDRTVHTPPGRRGGRRRAASTLRTERRPVIDRPPDLRPIARPARRIDAPSV
jgi:hypothetical protein